MGARALLLLAGVAAAAGAQILVPAELGLIGWRAGDPIEVRPDGEGGFWVRGPAGVLAVDGELRPRAWAAALFLGTAGGLDWHPAGEGFFVVTRAEGGPHLFHRSFPQGLAYPHFRPPAAALPPPPDLPWIQVDTEAGVGFDLTFQVWVQEGGDWSRRGQVTGATSVCRTPEAVWVAAPRKLVAIDRGGRIREWSLAVNHPLVSASGERVVLIDPEQGTVRVVPGTEDKVGWDFWQAAEEEAQRLEANFKGWALERLAAGLIEAYRERHGDFGPWLERIHLGRTLRAGFARARLLWKESSLEWELDPDDRDTRRTLDLVVAAVPLNVETVYRRIGYRGSIRLETAGARVLWLQFIRGREVQEFWVVEEP